MSTLRKMWVAVLVLGWTGFSACSDAKTAGIDLAQVWSDAPLGEARAVADVRASAEAGKEVVVSGRVKDFVSGLAAFTLIDNSLKSCRDNVEENCPTPWDYCCIDSAEKVLNIVTIEFLGPDERPLRQGLKGERSLDHLDRVTIRGTVHRDAAGNVRLAATKMHRQGT